MANGWMKSLQCKSTAVDDVAGRSQHRNNHRSNPKNHHIPLANSANCRNSVQNLKDMVEIAKPRKARPLKAHQKETVNSRKSDAGKPEESNSIKRKGQPTVSGSSSGWLLRATGLFFPALTELQEGHPSRNVVEIIFHTRWGLKNFPGRIEMVFKVQNLVKTLARFEEYREAVKSRARSRISGGVDGGGEDQARCVADGNEVMRFHCLGDAGKGVYDSGGGACALDGGQKRTPICTFSETGGAHESAGGGKGRKAMLVSRVIAGRVCKRVKLDSSLGGRVEHDSVSRENELVPRLPSPQPKAEIRIQIVHVRHLQEQVETQSSYKIPNLNGLVSCTPWLEESR